MMRYLRLVPYTLIAVVLFYSVLITSLLVYAVTDAYIKNEDFELTTIHKYLPCVIIYTDDLEGTTSIAESTSIIVKIPPSRKGDILTRVHELKHVEQAYDGWLILDAVRSMYDPAYVEQTEKEAVDAEVSYYREKNCCKTYY